MNYIPKIIHQIWSSIDRPLPQDFELLSDTWKEHYPSWEYKRWNDEMMVSFIQEHYPWYWEKYNNFQYNIQRWDVIRYLILYKFGGMYVDFDYESIEPIDNLLLGKSCCFAMEPESHNNFYRKELVFNNAMMACEPEHFFMKRIIENVFSDEVVYQRSELRLIPVLKTTGPWKLIDLYEQATPDEKDSIYLIPAKFVTPFDTKQAQRVAQGEISEELEDCLSEAYAIHYFFGDWLKHD